VDPDTGLPRLLRGKCGTCIYRPGNLMHLNPGRREEMERQAVQNGSWIICHCTLPINPANPGWQAICRGFYDVHGQESIGIRFAHAFGGLVEVEPPQASKPQQESP
jgi:hypothetical protein